jgi:hypothetical protein
MNSQRIFNDPKRFNRPLQDMIMMSPWTHILYDVIDDPEQFRSLLHDSHLLEFVYDETRDIGLFRRWKFPR